MLGTKNAAVVLLLAVPLIGGCQSVFGGSRMARADQRAELATAQADYAAEQMALGRKALDDGQPGAAVSAFRNAKQMPEQAAAASNGLAIAYSQLGRQDLAERYFREALALAPGERRYQANLRRFYQATSAELAVVAAPAPTLDAPAPTTTQLAARDGTPSGMTVSRPVSRMARLSANEVRIGGGEPAPARPRTASVTVASKPATEARPAYPVRLSIGPREIFVGRAAAPASAPGKPLAVASRGYPVRIKLKASE